MLPKYAINLVPVSHQFQLQEVHSWTSDKSRYEQVGWMIIWILGCIHLLDISILHHNNSVSHGHGFRLVIGYIDEGGLQALMQFRDLCPHLHPELGIQVGQRFIHEKYLGITNHGSSQSYALHFSTGKYPGFSMEQMPDLQNVRRLLNPPIDFRFGHSSDFEAKSHILVHCHMWIKA
jgi:hypothetical protein